MKCIGILLPSIPQFPTHHGEPDGARLVTVESCEDGTRRLWNVWFPFRLWFLLLLCHGNNMVQMNIIEIYLITIKLVL